MQDPPACGKTLIPAGQHTNPPAGGHTDDHPPASRGPRLPHPEPGHHGGGLRQRGVPVTGRIVGHPALVALGAVAGFCAVLVSGLTGVVLAAVL